MSYLSSDWRKKLWKSEFQSCCFDKHTLFEKLFEEQKAIESYKKSIEVDDKFFDGYYNLGALYYNKGVKQIEVATAVPPNENERYIAETKKADQCFPKFPVENLFRCFEHIGIQTKVRHDGVIPENHFLE